MQAILGEEKNIIIGCCMSQYSPKKQNQQKYII